MWFGREWQIGLAQHGSKSPKKAMPKFTFKGVDASGQEVEGTVEDDTKRDAIASIRESGYYPTTVELAEGESLPEEAVGHVEEKTPAWPSGTEHGQRQNPSAYQSPSLATAEKPPSSTIPTATQNALINEPLRPYSSPFIAGLHLFAGCCAALVFLAFAAGWIMDTSNANEYNRDSRSYALTMCLWSGLLALINFGLAQIIDIIARASYAARQQVILLRQIVWDNGGEPKV